VHEDASPEPAVTVLVVDDQPLFRNAARTVIARTGGFVLVGEAVDGQDAIEKVEALRPQLVLMDIHMPVLDGIDATRRITAEHPTVAVVLLSSYDQADLPLEVEDSGARAYLHKEELAPGAVRALWAQHGSPDT
jgi:DNA-binding NarL/FixJ family response regulator